MSLMMQKTTDDFAKAKMSMKEWRRWEWVEKWNSMMQMLMKTMLTLVDDLNVVENCFHGSTHLGAQNLIGQPPSESDEKNLPGKTISVVAADAAVAME